MTYSASLNGPWLDAGGAQGVADTIRFVQVVVPPQTTAVLFAKVVPGIPAVMNFGAEAVAGQEPLTQACGGLDPFSPVRLGPKDSADGFGYTLGQIYSDTPFAGNLGKELLGLRASWQCDRELRLGGPFRQAAQHDGFPGQHPQWGLQQLCPHRSATHCR